MKIYKVLRPTYFHDCWGRRETDYEEYKMFTDPDKAEEVRKQIDGEIEVVEVEE